LRTNGKTLALEGEKQMPELAGPQGLFLVGVLCAFGAFAVTLGTTSLYANLLGQPKRR
jgi:hypothetical protein